MRGTSILALVVIVVSILELVPVSATFGYSQNYYYWKKTCFSKKKDRPNYEEKRSNPRKFKGSACSEGGVCDLLPCGIDSFGACPCLFDDDDEGLPFKPNHDFDKGKHGTRTGSHSSTGSSGTSSGSTGSISGDSTETSTETEDSDSSQHGSRHKRTSYDGSYVDKAGFRVYYQWYNSKRYYWFWNKDNEKKRFYERDNRRCYYYYKDSMKYEYYNGDDGKRHYYDKDGNTHTQSDSHSNSHSNSGSNSNSGSHSHSGSHSSSDSHSSSGSHSNSGSNGNSGNCDSGGLGGPKGYRKVCLAFRDADNIRHGFSIGYRQECLRGQDRCVIEEDKNGKLHRRCDYQSHCDKLGLADEKCTIAGCKLFGCKASDCPLTAIFGSFYSFNKRGKKCGCDFNCNSRDDCCEDVCEICGPKSPSSYSHCY